MATTRHSALHHSFFIDPNTVSYRNLFFIALPREGTGAVAHLLIDNKWLTSLYKEAFRIAVISFQRQKATGDRNAAIQVPALPKLSTKTRASGSRSINLETA